MQNNPLFYPRLISFGYQREKDVGCLVGSGRTRRQGENFGGWLQFMAPYDGNAYFYALASHENVTIKTYNPVNPLLPFHAMSRMHDKYVIVDDSLYLLGGRNVYDSFLGAQDGPKNYDRDVLVYHEGEKEGSLYQVKAYFEAIWNDLLCKTWNDNHLLA